MDPSLRLSAKGYSTASKKRGLGEDLDGFALEGGKVGLWLLPSSPRAIRVQRSLWIGFGMAIWRTLTSLPIQTSGSWARRPSPGLSNHSPP